MTSIRFLFVSSTVAGGSGKSQRQLANRLIAHGHQVRLLVDDESPFRLRRKVYEKLTDLEVKVDATALRPLVSLVASAMNGRPKVHVIEGVEVHATYVPENTIRHELERWRPDVVLGSSVDRLSWRKVSAQCKNLAVPTVLYLREEVALGHLTISKVIPDLLLANAKSIASAAEDLGFPCGFVPSVVELGHTATTSSRDVVLLINPIESHGIDLCLQLAALNPAIAFVLQESWELSRDERRDLLGRIAELTNIEFRARTDEMTRIYHDARVLIVPHRIDNRPRVIAEAQSNGIPVLASAHQGLVESVGAGGRILPTDDVAVWSGSIQELWSNHDLERSLIEAAVQHASRNELDPDWVARSFVELIRPVVEPRRNPG